jgi:multidrug efflux pump subunit AcrA (membrane-fusion protein)
VINDGTAVRRKIRLGIEQGNRIQVVEGLKPGEQLVVAGMNSLSDGAAVRIEKAEPGQKQPGGQEQ